MILLFLMLLSSYLLGSIPCGYLMGKIQKGIDIRNFGSGNIGTTNVLRSLGFLPAIGVLAGDMGKGIASVYMGFLLAPFVGINSQVAGGLAGLSSIVGHNWPIFLKFKGGKGVATSAGVFLILTPFPFIFSLGVMVLIVSFTRYVSLGSMIAAVSLPLFVLLWIKDYRLWYFVLTGIVAGCVLFRHRSNIARLLRGEERRLGKRSKC
ncbi:acyl-phosphate glycerol 3-phosphate acyltransferase [Candidatus Aerophobetes bacterium]|uniref:Glycerol-3-phosphate acyltransferase n=1 Tax=Aerophobetes bacterium TaxID=2030807 RepID=A0A662D3D2_UNCAE|nr:MAG: acyl-phosphate glycerol 3-phosphate acyltransferase [Candidatus Aerophobetes bacterium]